MARGKKLDALGSDFRLSAKDQQRTEELLSISKQGRRTAAQRRELDALLRKSDDILLRRAGALPNL